MSQSNMAASSNGTNEDNQIGVSGNTLPVSSNIIWVFFCFLKPFAIVPKYDCPHLGGCTFLLLRTDESDDNQQPPCAVCNETQENWICIVNDCNYVSDYWKMCEYMHQFCLCN